MTKTPWQWLGIGAALVVTTAGVVNTASAHGILWLSIPQIGVGLWMLVDFWRRDPRTRRRGSGDTAG